MPKGRFNSNVPIQAKVFNNSYSIYSNSYTTPLRLRLFGSKADAAKVSEKLELAIKYLSESNYEQAILAYQEVIKIDPKEVKAYQGLAKVYTIQSKYEEAKSTYEQGLSAILAENQLKLKLSLAGMYIDKGDLAEAEKSFKMLKLLKSLLKLAPT